MTACYDMNFLINGRLVHYLPLCGNGDLYLHTSLNIDNDLLDDLRRSVQTVHVNL